MKMRSALFIFQLVFFLSACLGGQSPAPVSNFGQSPGAGSAGVHNVVAGETVYSLSRRYNIAQRDIVIFNNLHAPFRLAEGQRVKLPPPQEYRVREGDSLYTVSRVFGVNSSEVARLNRMNAPYTLRIGQVLRLPSVFQKPPTPLAVATQNIQPASPAQPIIRETLAPLPGTYSAGNSPTLASGSVVASSPSPPNPTAKPVVSSSAKLALSAPPPRSGKVFMRPVSGPIVSAFGPKKSGLHNDGINVQAPKGTPVRAAENGIVVYSGNELKGTGNLVLLRHEGQWMTAYAHMDRIMVERGKTVHRGETLGTVGTSGSVAAPQLHFEVRRGTEALNPVNYIEK